MVLYYHVKTVFAAVIFCLLSSVIFAQLKQREIIVGEVCPDIEIGRIINYPVTSARISDFKGKLLILDFWATWCSPCVAFFRQADSLQKQFGDKVLILPVTSEDTELVAAFLARMKKITGINPPSVTKDSVLRLMFPHSYIPHEVWIDEDGVVKAITSYRDVTAENINAVLNGQQIKALSKKDEQTVSVDVTKPVLTGDQGVTIKPNELLYNSVLTRYKPDLSSWMTVGNFICMRNISLLYLYKVAFGEGSTAFFLDNKVELQVKDTLKFTYPQSLSSDKVRYNNWKLDNLYCYELNIGDSSLFSEKFKLMQDDINRYFNRLGINGKLENKKKLCWVLTRTSSSDKLKSKGGKQVFTRDAFNINLKNTSLKELIEALQIYYYQLSPLPVLDDTKYTSPVDMELTCKISDMNVLNSALEKYDLKFVQIEKAIDVVVITQK